VYWKLKEKPFLSFPFGCDAASLSDLDVHSLSTGNVHSGDATRHIETQTVEMQHGTHINSGDATLHTHEEWRCNTAYRDTSSGDATLHTDINTVDVTLLKDTHNYSSYISLSLHHV
jgi:hypothetical protein